MNQTARVEEPMREGAVLYLSIELGWSKWHLAFATQRGEDPRLRSVDARDLPALRTELELGKQRFGLPAQALFVSCYEAGRDGFWLHRCLSSWGWRTGSWIPRASSQPAGSPGQERWGRCRETSGPADPRARSGEKRVWSVVRVPSIEVEDALELLGVGGLKERAYTAPQSSPGVVGESGPGHVPRQEVCRAVGAGPAVGRSSRGAGPASSSGGGNTSDSKEFKSRSIAWKSSAARRWRRAAQSRHWNGCGSSCCSRRSGSTALGCSCESSSAGGSSAIWCSSLGALGGLAPTPYQSGDRLHREQGIGAGNGRVRSMMIEIAWGWLRLQPRSQLSQWFHRRFGGGNSRSRRVGIVALARKLLVALWRYLETGEIPEGAELEAA